MTPIQELSQKILKARTVEEIFGELIPADNATLQRALRKLQMQVHPDHNKESNANAVFEALTKLAELAEKAIASGAYGKNLKINTTIVRSKSNEYEIGDRSYTGETTILYRGTDQNGVQVMLKIAKTVGDNKKLKDTTGVLKKLRESLKDEKPPVVPVLVDQFHMTIGGEKREVLVYEDPQGGGAPTLTLTKIMQHYPKGVEPAHFVWMMKRILGALLHADKAGILHGAVLPCHIVVNPDSHLERLVGWSHAVEYNKPRKEVIGKYKEYYPEDYKKASADNTADVYMLAKCMIKVLGGDIITNDLPATVPWAIQGFLKSLVVGNSRLHPHTVFTKLVKLAGDVFGPPKYVNLTIPN